MNLRSQTSVRHLLWTTLLVIITTIVYAPSVTGGWIGDDFFLVVNRECARGLHTWPSIILQRAEGCTYRPTRFLSYALDFEIWGLNPLGYRLTNLVTHLVSTFLVLGIFRLLGISFRWAWVGACLFAIHPVQADAVAYISGRRDVLTGFGYFLSFYAAIQFDRCTDDKSSRPWQKWVWCFVVGLGAVVSVTSKEMGVTIAAILVVFLAIGGKQAIAGSLPHRPSIASLVRKYWFVLTSVAIVASAVVLHRGILKPISTVTHTWFGGSLTNHIATILGVHGRYLEILVFPARLPGDYSPPVIPIADSFLTTPTLIGSVWLGSLLIGAAWSFRRRWYREAFGIVWYLISMLPVSHIIPHHEIAAEHYLYIPITGLILVTVSLLQRLAEHATQERTSHLITVALCLVVGLLMARTTVRSFDYRSELAHSKATLQVEPESVRGNARYGIALLTDGSFEEAKPHLQYVLGTNFQGSARLSVLKALGRYYVDSGRYDIAIKPLSEYLQSRSNNLDVIELLAYSYLELNDYETSLHLTQKLISLSPKTPGYYYLRGLALARSGQSEKAVRAVLTALDMEEQHLPSLLLAANLHAASDSHKAVKLLERAQIQASQQALEPWQAQQLERLEDKLMPRPKDAR